MNNFGEKANVIWGVADLIRDTFKRGKYQTVMRTFTAPLDEQRQIVAHCRYQSSQIDNFASTLTASIETVKDFRATLIAAAVTGKADVQDPSPTPPRRGEGRTSPLSPLPMGRGEDGVEKEQE